MVSSRSKTLRAVLTSVEDLEILEDVKQDFHIRLIVWLKIASTGSAGQSLNSSRKSQKRARIWQKCHRCDKDKRLYQRLKEALGKSDLDGYELEAEVQLFRGRSVYGR